MNIKKITNKGKTAEYYKGLLMSINFFVAQELDKKENPTLRKIYNFINQEVL